MEQAHAVDDLIGGIYDAATDPELWPAAIARIVVAVGCRSGIFYEHDVATRRSQPLGYHQLDPAFMRDYEQYYAALDPWNRRVLGWPVGVVAPTYALISDAEFRRTEFYQDHLRLTGIFYGLGGVVDRTRDRMAVFGVQCAYEDGRFSEPAQDLVKQLMPHLRRAYRVQSAIREARLRHGTLEDTLNLVRQPVLLLERSGRMVFANRSAKGLIDEGDGWQLEGGRLVAAHRGDRAALGAAISHGAPVGGGAATIRLRRSGGRPPLVVQAMPLRGRGRVALLVQTEPSDPPPMQQLAELYLLTAAETRLWAGLIAGRTLAQMARKHAVSVNTLRVQLGSLFQKVGAHRQADLVRLAFAHRDSCDGRPCTL